MLILIFVVLFIVYLSNQENYMDLVPDYFVRRNSSYDIRGEAYIQPRKEFLFNNSEIGEYIPHNI